MEGGQRRGLLSPPFSRSPPALKKLRPVVSLAATPTKKALGKSASSPYTEQLPRFQKPAPRHGEANATGSDRDSCASIETKLAPLPITRDDLTSLYTLFHPTPQFQGKVTLDLQHIDLRWLLRKPVKGPQQLLTLNEMRDDVLTTPTKSSTDTLRQREAVMLNSPRSAITLLRNGLTIADLQHTTFDHFHLQGSLEGLPKHVIVQRYEHVEKKRQMKWQSLLEEYQVYCNKISLPQIIDFFSKYDQSSPSTIPPLSERVDDFNEDNCVSLGSVQLSMLSEQPSPTRGNVPGPPETTTSGSVMEPTIDAGSSEAPNTLDDQMLPQASTVHSDQERSETRYKAASTVDSDNPQSWAQAGAAKMDDSRKRLEKLLKADLGVRERAIQLRQQTIEASAAREIMFERKMRLRKLLNQQAQQEKIAAAQANVERRKAIADQRSKMVTDRSSALLLRQQATEEIRGQAVEYIKEQRRNIAAKNKDRRLEKLLATQQRGAEMEEQRIIQFEAKQKARRERAYQLETEKKAAQLELKQKSMEQAQKRLWAQQRSALIELQRRLEAEDRQERMNHRVEQFLSNQEEEEGLRRQLDEICEEKRRTVYDNAVQIQELRRQDVLNRRAAFETRWVQIQDERKTQGDIEQEESRLKCQDKEEFRDRRKNIAEYEKLGVIDNIQRKVDKIDKTDRSKSAVLAAIKYDYEEKKRERDRVIADMSEQQIKNEKKVTYEIVNSPSLDVTRAVLSPS